VGVRGGGGGGGEVYVCDTRGVYLYMICANFGYFLLHFSICKQNKLLE
jgi:hypothetical protein